MNKALLFGTVSVLAFLLLQLIPTAKNISPEPREKTLKELIECRRISVKFLLIPAMIAIQTPPFILGTQKYSLWVGYCRNIFWRVKMSSTLMNSVHIRKEGKVQKCKVLSARLKKSKCL